MYGINEWFELKDDDLVIQRYMDIEKFQLILENKALYFCNSEQFDDNFEGSTKQLNNLFRDAIYSNKMNELKKEASDTYRKMIHINYWRINNNESRGMWDLYTNKKQGIVIKSTLGDLKQAIEEDERIIYINRVAYLDCEKTFIPEQCMFYPFLCKRNNFKHECELRALLLKGNHIIEFSETEIRGTQIATDLNKLVNKVIVHPNSCGEFKEGVNQLINRHGYKFIVEQSELDKNPIFQKIVDLRGSPSPPP